MTIIAHDPCELAARWGIDDRLATLLQLWIQASLAAFPNTVQGRYFRLAVSRAQIISGYRTRERQEELNQEGRPAAPDHLSTHRSCPATGADIRISGTSDEVVSMWLVIGPVAESIGLRWGGGSPRNAEGMPSDFNHLDLGPRRQ